MKKSILLLLSLTLTLVAISQTTFTYKENLFKDPNRWVDISFESSGFYKFVFYDKTVKPSNLGTDTIYTLSQDILEKLLLKYFMQSGDAQKCREESGSLFYLILWRKSESSSSRPIAGYLVFKNKNESIIARPFMSPFSLKEYLRETMSQGRKLFRRTVKRGEMDYKLISIKNYSSWRFKYKLSFDTDTNWYNRRYFINTKSQILYDSLNNKINRLKEKKQMLEQKVKPFDAKLLDDSIKWKTLKGKFNKQYLDLYGNQNCFITDNYQLHNFKRDTLQKQSNKTDKLSVLIKQDSNSFKFLIKRQAYYDSIKMAQLHLRYFKEEGLQNDTIVMDSLSIEFKGSIIQNIQLLGHKKNEIKNKSNIMLFYNLYPLGFSSMRNFNQLKSENLFCKLKDTLYTIRLDEFISEYIPVLQSNRRDYGPSDSVYKYVPGEVNTKTLFKEQTSKLFMAKVFSDFLGFENKNPNGVLQTEVNREIPIFTQRFLFSQSFLFQNLLFHNPLTHFINIDKYVNDNLNIGFLSYINPQIIISKLENSNKYFIISQKDSSRISTIHLKQYEVFSAGFDLNGLLLDLPEFKSCLYLDPKLYFGLSNISKVTGARQDTLNFGVNTIQYGYSIKWKIQTDERYSFSLGFTKNYLKLLDTQFSQVNDNLNIASTKDLALEHFELFVSRTTSSNSNGEFFLRYRYNFPASNFKAGFHQIQVGYSFYLTEK
jgi:hypothetical protein